jgi:hypothetical protein
MAHFAKGRPTEFLVGTGSRHEPIHPSLRQVLQIFLRAIPAVRQDSFRSLSRLFSDRLDQRYHLLFIVGGLCHRLPHNQLEKRLDRNLRVVPLHESIRPVHDARLWICKVVLGLRLGLSFLAIFTLALGFLSRSVRSKEAGREDSAPAHPEKKEER